MRKFALMAASFAVAINWALVHPQKVDAISAGTIINLTNSERAKHCLPPLRQSSILGASAQAKAAHMLANNYWAHTAPDGTSYVDFITNAGYRGVKTGENLAEGYSTDSAVIASWMNSPSHKANILGPYSEIGVATLSGILLGRSTTLVVAHYGATSTVSTTTCAPVANAPVAAPSPTSSSTKPGAKTQSPKPTAAVQAEKPAETTPPEIKAVQETISPQIKLWQERWLKLLENIKQQLLSLRNIWLGFLSSQTKSQNFPVKY